MHVQVVHMHVHTHVDMDLRMSMSMNVRCCPTTVLEIGKIVKSFKMLVPGSSMTGFSTAQLLCYYEGLLRNENALLELQLVLAALWACGSAMSTSGGDHCKALQ